jgi:uncharacterized membrane protein HdeD (DUF308 family)
MSSIDKRCTIFGESSSPERRLEAFASTILAVANAMGTTHLGGTVMSQRGPVRGGADPAARALNAGSLAFELAKKWWVLLLRGILLIIVGLLAFVSPLVWVTFVGIYMLFDGFSLLMAGFSDQPAGQSRWPLLITGVLGLVAGLIVLWNPELGGLTLTIVIAAWAIITGILTIISAIRVREEIDNEWWLIISGVLAIIFGILVFQNVLAGILTIAWIFAIFAIVAGILSIALAFRVRDFGTRIGAVT